MFNAPAHRLPTHRVYAVTPTRSGKSFWKDIGALWPHADGQGFGLKLEYLPLDRVELVARAPLPKRKEGEAPDTDSAVTSRDSLSGATGSREPTLIIYAVTPTRNGKFWKNIGALWPHADGQGFGIKLEYLPLDRADLVARAPLPKREEGEVSGAGSEHDQTLPRAA